MALHVAAPILIIPLVAFLLRRSPDTDGGSGLITAMILIVAMPVAAGATVWTVEDHGDQPTMVGLVIASTLVSPLTVPAVVSVLAPLLSTGYANVLGTAGPTVNSGFALTGVVMPCVAGIVARLLLPERWLERALHVVVPVAMAGSLVLTYTNASGALGSFVTRPGHCCSPRRWLWRRSCARCPSLWAGWRHGCCVWTWPPPRPSRSRAA